MSSESVLAQLRGQLIAAASIDQQTGEKFDNSTLDQWLRDAILEHDVSLGGDFSRLPQEHYRLVLILAQIQVCEARAIFFSKQPDTLRRGDHQFGSGNSVQAENNRKMAQHLRDRYNFLKAQLQDQGELDTNQIQQSKLFRKDAITNLVTETPSSLIESPFLVIGTPVDEGGGAYSVILTWTTSVSRAFEEYFVYKSLNADIYEPWNHNQGSTIEFINDSAERLLAISNITINQVKVTGLTSGLTYYFLVVTKSTQGRHAYSNEVSVTIP